MNRLTNAEMETLLCTVRNLPDDQLDSIDIAVFESVNERMYEAGHHRDEISDFASTCIDDIIEYLDGKVEANKLRNKNAEEDNRSLYTDAVKQG